MNEKRRDVVCILAPAFYLYKEDMAWQGFAVNAEQSSMKKMENARIAKKKLKTSKRIQPVPEKRTPGRLKGKIKGQEW